MHTEKTSTLKYNAAIGADHAGYALQQAMVAHWKKLGEQPFEVGTTSTDSVDYPLFAARVCEAIQQGMCERGLLICNSGIGMAIAANRFRGIRAVWADRPEIVEQSRCHNNANVLCVAAMWTNLDQLIQLWQTFVNTPFDGSERHVRRVQLMDA